MNVTTGRMAPTDYLIAEGFYGMNEQCDGRERWHVALTSAGGWPAVAAWEEEQQLRTWPAWIPPRIERCRVIEPTVDLPAALRGDDPTVAEYAATCRGIRYGVLGSLALWGVVLLCTGYIGARLAQAMGG